MQINDIKDLIALVNTSKLTEFELTLDQCNVRMSKNSSTLPSGTANQKISSSAVEDKEKACVPQDSISQDDPPAGEIVKSPIVGTFYRAQGPDKKELVTLGQHVEKGDVLCIIEAMKIMNEITSPHAGQVAEIYPKSEQLVEYGQALFRIV